MTATGMDMAALEHLRRPPKLIYVMPNYQNPTTASWTASNKAALLRYAVRCNAYILEDDSQAVGAPTLYAQDTAGRVIYLKSFSKIMMPGLRMGFLIAPPELSERLLQAKYATDIGSSGFLQRAFDLYLRNGGWDAHLSAMQTHLAQRYQLLLGYVPELEAAGAQVSHQPHGQNLWLTLPPNRTDAQMTQACQARRLVVAPGSLFAVNGGVTTHVRLNLAGVPENELAAGMGIVRECLQGDVNRAWLPVL